MRLSGARIVLLALVAAVGVGTTTACKKKKKSSTAGAETPSDPVVAQVGQAASSIPPATIPPGALRWSDPATWGGQKPTAGEDVIVESDQHLILDEDTSALGTLTINGTLEFARANLTLTADTIFVDGGTLRIGSEAEPFTPMAVIVLTGEPEDSADSFRRGIMVMNGALEMYGTPPATAWTKLAEHAAAGSTNLSLLAATGWSSGSQIIVAPTDFYEVASTELLTVSSVAADSITVTPELQAFRWGRLQYVSASGLSLDEADLIELSDSMAGTPTILDERAVVANVSRNILIEAPDDEFWQDEGFGVSVMIMGPGASGKADGVMIRRAGQRARLGRYPWHWHMVSYGDGEELEDAEGQFFRNSSVVGSSNRGLVIHGTNGVAVQGSIFFDIVGHGVFTEDAVERRNEINGNLVFKVRSPRAGEALKFHESYTGNAGGSSCFWVSNPDNAIDDNIAGDCDGFGFWLAFPAHPWGLNVDVPIIPRRTLFGSFARNTAQSSRFHGVMIDLVEVDNDGSIAGSQYASTADGLDPIWPRPHLRRFHIDGLATWKNAGGGIWDRASWPDNSQIVSADNAHRFFAGAGEDGVIEHSLVIGSSLNSDSPRPTFAGDPTTPSAFATYHSSFRILRNLVVNFPVVPGSRSGAFATEDYYLRAVDKGHIRNEDNILINSHPGFRMQARWSNGVLATHFNLAGALWDPHGIWGVAGHYFVYDQPFFTFGVDAEAPVGGAEAAGGVLAPGPYYGINAFVVDNANDSEDDRMAIRVDRLDPSNVGNVVGNLSIDAAPADWLLAHMRSFAAHRDGIYRISFPDQTPTTLRLTFEGLLTSEDTLLLAIPLTVSIAESATNAVRISRPNPYLVEVYERVGSLAAVRSSSGATWWQDESKVVWVKLRGGLWEFWTSDANVAEPSDDDLLYEPMYLHVDGQ